jgi:hypothetical protein
MTLDSDDTLQLSLFNLPDKRQANYTALFDLAPRYIQQTDRSADTLFLDGIVREFSFNGERYRLSLSPARITDPSTGVARDELPGEREQLVEDVVRKLASERMMLGGENRLMCVFTVYAVWAELKRHKHTFSKAEVKEALTILNKCALEITKIGEPGERKPRPMVSAAVFPVLVLANEADPSSQTYVQFNPLLEHAIKTLGFEMVNYEWMMRIRGQVTRWVFKNVSLTLANDDAPLDFIEISAAEIAANSGTQWSRSRNMLAHIGKAIAQLKAVDVVDEVTTREIKDGRTKVDVRYTLKLSSAFINDRMAARRNGKFRQEQAARIAGTAKPTEYHGLDNAASARLRLAKTDLLTGA